MSHHHALRATPRARSRTATIQVMPEPADDDTRGPGRPRVGPKYAFAIPAEILEDARELVRKGEYRKLAEPLRQWLVDGHAAWRRQR